MKTRIAQLYDKEIEMLQFDNDDVVEPSKINECQEGKLCKPIDFFERIEKCDLCGKLL